MSGEPILTIVGNLVADPELRYTPNSVAVCTFRVASTPRVYDRQANEWKDGTALFQTCTVWREHAENVAETCGVSRRAQDEYAVRSQNLAEAVADRGFWERDITPVRLPDGTVVTTDDGPRRGVTLERVESMQPVFRPDGTVTAANCCPLNDGAAALVVMSDTRAAELGIPNTEAGLSADLLDDAD